MSKNIKVGDTFKYNGKDGGIYTFEVTRKNEKDYTVQAMTCEIDGKIQHLFGPVHIVTLHLNDNEIGGVKLSETYDWKEGSE